MTPWDLAKSGTEAGEQRALFAWAAMAYRCGLRVADDPLAYTGMQAELNGIKELKWLHAIHNQGHGDAIHGGIAKAEGVKAGVSDVFLPVATDTKYKKGQGDMYYGLYIEMKKVKGGVASKEQLEFQTDMIAEGYACVICKGWLEARDQIIKYLGLD